MRVVRGSLMALVLCCGCSVDLSVPPAARVTCVSNEECPAPSVCKQALGLCVSAEGDDGRAPGVSAVSITPAVATVGGAFTLTLTTDEQLAIEPEVVLGDSGHFTVTAVDGATKTYTLTYAVRGTEASGARPVSATLVDDFGNVAQLVVASAALDFIAPRIGAGRWVLPGAKRAVKPGDTVSLVASIDPDAELTGATLFSDDTALADVSSAFLVSASGSNGSLQLQGDITIPMDVVDGALLAVGFALADVAGNVTNPAATMSPALPVDAQPPQGILTLPATSTSATVNAQVSSIDAISVSFTGDVLSPVGAQAPVPVLAVLVLTDGNGVKSVTAVFEDEAGNQTTTAPALITVTVPPGPGSPGLACATDSECNSLTCACAEPTCGTRRCAIDASCGACKYVDASGVCVGNVNSETQDPLNCVTPLTCSGGFCLTARGEACTQPSECVTGFCECKDAGCTGKICANADCGSCAAGANCSITRTNDSTCDAGKVCRLGSCVVRAPGSCTAVCQGNLTCLGPYINSDNCNTTQGFSAQFTGFCPNDPPCTGSPSCSCL